MARDKHNPQYTVDDFFTSQDLPNGGKVYHGTKKTLVAAHVARPTWFPDGEKRWIANRAITLPDGERVLMRRNPSGTFVVTRYPKAPEQLAAVRAWAQKRKAQPRAAHSSPPPAPGKYSEREEAFFHSVMIEPRPPAGLKIAAAEVYDRLVRLKACTALVCNAMVDIRPRVGGSSKLARALLDLEQAVAQLGRVGSEIEVMIGWESRFGN